MDADGGYPVAEEVQLATQGDKGAAGRLAQAGILLPVSLLQIALGA